MTHAVRRDPLRHGWQLCALPAGAPPGAEAALGPADWIDAGGHGTVAAALRAAGHWSLDGPPRRFDAEDWCWRLAFDAEPAAGGESVLLLFDGLATVAEVRLNGEPLLRSDNMFVAHRCDVGAQLRGRNELLLRFAALDPLVATPRARPRWRAPMVEHQQLRWWRTTLLGRTPGWSPPAAPVGPWRGIRLERRSQVELADMALHATLDGRDGRIAFQGRLRGLGGRTIEAVELRVARGETLYRSALTCQGGAELTCQGGLTVPDAAPWWPHTHGEPALYRATLHVRLAGAAAPVEFALGDTGFRRIELDTDGGRFALRVNGVPVFCRGACWMPLDPVGLSASPEALREAVATVRDAGMNMLRVSGATVYEDEAFHDECDRQGVLVWQDFMFANMDYPGGDAAFRASVEREVRQQAARWRHRPSLAVLCGNSEVEQQAAMWGAPRELWAPPIFHEHIAGWAREACPGVPYWPSSAHGGAFPHQVDTGTTSYYGVGAYLGPWTDARRAGVKFATECLGFANVPTAATIARMPGGHGLRVHHPGWKVRAPRDLGAGWDFEDVRDHYLGQLFGLDATALRRVDHDRYLALSRAVTGEVMASALAEWRRAGSGCGGALLWFLRDLWAGAGWGLLDDMGLPKPCFWPVRRVLQPVALAIGDEGHNGLHLHAFNDHAAALDAVLELVAYPDEGRPVAQASQALQVAPRGALTVAAAELLDGFYDLSYAYRFGPPPATRVWAGLRDAAGELLAQAWHFPVGPPTQQSADTGLTAGLERADNGLLTLGLQAGGFVQDLCIEADGLRPDDNHFHLRPGESRRVALHPAPAAPATHRAQVGVSSLNARRRLVFEVPR
ncbi:MAG TPA: glycoside hydrolase family 2 protein [Methylibium sp.]|nr:glycoside hydrolase family 2 protein [Methylibium sp.]